MDRSKFVPVFALVSLVLSTPGWTADNELYDDPPPEDAAFVRWLGESAAPEILGVSMPDIQSGMFHPVSAALTDGAQAGSFYTAAVDSKGHVAVIQEPNRADRSKVLLTLLNISDSPVRLVLLDHNTEVIGNTAVNDASGRSVNPVSATLAVVSASGAELGIFEVQLRRGQNLTFVARPESADLIENRFGPNIEG